MKNSSILRKEEIKSSSTCNCLPQTKELISNPNISQNFVFTKLGKRSWIVDFLWMSLKMVFCCIFLCTKRKKREESLTKIKTKLYSLPILSFFSRLVLVLRAIKKFRNQTIYRKPDNLKKIHYYLIDDYSNITNIDQNASSENLFYTLFRFVSSKMNKKLRKIIKGCLQRIFSLLSKNKKEKLLKKK